MLTAATVFFKAMIDHCSPAAVELTHLVVSAHLEAREEASLARLWYAFLSADAECMLALRAAPRLNGELHANLSQQRAVNCDPELVPFDADAVRSVLVREKMSRGRQGVGLLPGDLARLFFDHPALFQEHDADREFHGLVQAHPQLMAALRSPVNPPAPQPVSVPKNTFGIGVDLVALAEIGEWPESPLVGQSGNMELLRVALTSRGTTPLLLGDPGVGKSTLVYGLAYAIARRDFTVVSSELLSCRIYSINPSEILQAAKNRGTLAEKMVQLIEAARVQPNVILFIDEIHRLLDNSNTDCAAIADALKPALASGQIRCIGATTRREYDRYLVRDAALVDRFTLLNIEEPSRDEALEILRRAADSLLGAKCLSEGITMEPEALAAAVDLSIQFQPLRKLPRKAFDLARLAIATKFDCVRMLLNTSRSITRVDMAAVIARWNQVPVDYILNPAGDTRFRIARSALRREVIGQDHVVDGVLDHLRLQARGWLHPDRPLGVFLFVGPPGVGKTQLATSLARHALTRRSEPITQSMAGAGFDPVAQFMGSPAGYRDSGTTETVFSKIRSGQQNSVLLLDEIEKAPQIFTVLLDILTGQARDALGERTDFRQCLILMTSNALPERWGLADLELSILRQELVDPEKMQHPFPKELIDRLDGIFLFRALDEEALLSILRRDISRRSVHSGLPLPGDLDENEAAQRHLVQQLMASKAAAQAPASRFVSARDLSGAITNFCRSHLPAL